SPAQLRGQPEIVDQSEQRTIRRKNAVIILVPPERAEIEVRRQSAELRLRLEQRHAGARLQQIESRGQAGNAAAVDAYVAWTWFSIRSQCHRNYFEPAGIPCARRYYFELPGDYSVRLCVPCGFRAPRGRLNCWQSKPRPR